MTWKPTTLEEYRMSRKLTSKQERFAIEVASGKTASDAYRAAYDVRSRSPSRAWSEGSRLMAHPMVSARIRELRDRAAERVHHDY
jgi:phage terminase small subunit